MIPSEKIFLKRTRLGEQDAKLYQQTTPPEKFQQRKFDKKLKNKQLAPVVIAICLHRQASGKIPEEEECLAIACAMQNLHLLATAYGLVGYWSSGKYLDSADMKDWLQNESDFETGTISRCLGLFHLGYPSPDKPYPSGHRKEMDESMVKWM